jgi:signal transduction histidine kinase/ligand-binding sensor domain-containing protein/DNA-binding response OmpR family regulator
MRRFLITIFFSLILVFPAFWANAQPDNMSLRYLRTEEGLSQNEVTSIIQDNEGFMWFGTRSGLNRYDGYKFLVFDQVPGDSSSLVNTSIERIYKDSKGIIWIGTKSNGISRYNPVTGKFLNIPFNGTSAHNILPDKRVLSFCEDSNGEMWIGTWNGGLLKYNPETGQGKTYNLAANVNVIIKASNGVVWVGTNNGLFEYDGVNDSFKRLPSQTGSSQIPNIIEDRNHRFLWILQNNKSTLLKLDMKDRSMQTFSLNPSEQKEFGQFNGTTKIMQDNNGILWIGTWGNGLFQFNPADSKFSKIPLYPSPLFKNNNEFDTILDIFQDRNNNIWIGSNGVGVCLLTEKLKFNTLGLTKDQTLNKCVMSVLEDKNGTLWVGTKGSGLYFSVNKVDFYEVPFTALKNQDQFKLVRAIYEDMEGKIWIGTSYNTGIIRYSHGIPELIACSDYFNDRRFEPIQKAVTFTETDNSLYIGTQQRGLFLVEKKTGSFGSIRNFQEKYGDNGQLQNERVSYLLKDSKQRIWVATYDGLCIFNPDNETFTNINTYFSLPQVFDPKILFFLYESSDKSIWIGTPIGLYQLEEKTGNNAVFHHITMEQGLSGNQIMGITEDNLQNLWISTNAGISKYNLKTKKFHNFNTIDGLRSTTFSETSVFKGKNNMLYFGGTFGLNSFNPDEIVESDYKNNIVLTNLSLFNQRVEIGKTKGNHTILEKSLNNTTEITFDNQQKNFQIEFSALDYKASGKNQYAYKLDNFDKDWNYIGTQHFINFNNLQPGEYTLNIKSSSNNYIWNEQPRKLKIIIKPPVWQTWYAIIFYVMLIMGIVTIIRWNAVKQVRMAKNLEIEKIKHEQDQRISEMKFQFFTNISHEFRTPLTLIFAPLKELIQKAQAYKLQDEALEKIQVIYKNTNQLMKLINQLLDFRKAETESLKLVARYLNIEDFIKESCYPFFELAKIKNIDFQIDATLKNKEIWFDRDKMEMIINNLVSNAFKFNKIDGSIKITLEEDVNEVIIKVADSGKGIPSSAIDHVFERFYQVDNGENIGSTGIGLALVKYLVELHHGIIEVDSELGKGTEFRLRLKKGKDHLNSEQLYANEAEGSTFVREESALSRFLPQRNKRRIDSDTCILIIDDNPDVNQYLVSLLEPYYRVESAINGKEGFSKAVELNPNLIVSDVMMPEMDGFELCKKIKANILTATVPVILLTAKSADQYKLMGIQTGADDYISKPFDPDYLLEKVQKLLLSQAKLKKQYSKSIRLDPSDIEIEASDELFLKKSISIIEKNLQNDGFSAETLATTLNLSSSSLYRKLKSLTNLSSAEFIRSIRIKRAAQLLQDNNKTISEVAYEVGFNDLKNFRQIFQKHYQCSPSEFRKNNSSRSDLDKIKAT